jgi:hypothetical protein
VLINSAVELNNKMSTPNFSEGHGRVNLAATLPLGSTAFGLYTHQGALSSSQQFSYVLTVKAGATAASYVNMTLVWTDPPAQVASAAQGAYTHIYFTHLVYDACMHAST